MISGRIEKLAKLFENSDRHTEKEKRDIIAKEQEKEYALIQVWDSENPDAIVQFYYARGERCGVTFSEGVPPRSRRAYANRIAKAAEGEVETVAEDF